MSYTSDYFDPQANSSFSGHAERFFSDRLFSASEKLKEGGKVGVLGGNFMRKKYTFSPCDAGWDSYSKFIGSPSS